MFLEYINQILPILPITLILFIFSFSCSFGFFLSLYAWFFIVFSFPDFSENTGLCTLPFESLQSIIKRFVFFNPDFRHVIPPLRWAAKYFIFYVIYRMQYKIFHRALFTRFNNYKAYCFENQYAICLKFTVYISFEISNHKI